MIVHHAGDISLAIVPQRTVDPGGWSDTWFAQYGQVLNLGVYSRPYCESKEKGGPFRGVSVLCRRLPSRSGVPTVYIGAADIQYDTCVEVDQLASGDFNHRNLLLAVLSLLSLRAMDYYVTINRVFPPGASVGTSAAVAVAVIAAVAPASMMPDEFAHLAWRAETEVMGGQSGTQDQYTAALGGDVNYIAISNFPNTRLESVAISPATRQALEDGLITAVFGSHDSSAIHRMVIAELEHEGPFSRRLEDLRQRAGHARHSLESGNLVGFGKVMSANTEAQRALHPDLVSHRAQQLIDGADDFEALGWKVNGAGGAGGSVTFLFESRQQAVDFWKTAQSLFPEVLFFEHRLAGSYPDPM